MQIEFPMSDYGPKFEKEYEIHGAKFTVWVQNVGPSNLGPTWLFAIIVKGNTIEGGPYHPKFERELTEENVANQLASFWGHTKLIQDAHDLEGSPDWELDQIVEKCAAFMNGYLVAENYEHTDYDIAMKAMDEESWVVILRPNYMANRLFEFYKTTEMEKVEVHSYIEDNELSVKF